MRRLLVFLILLLAHGLHADSWSLPGPETVESTNGQWRFTITPKRLTGQLEYFEDKVAGKPDAGAVRDGGPNEARGELFRKTDGDTWQRVAAWRLVNEVAPVSALVANDGSVVTFDNWHAMGYGDDVVVIYRPDGTLVRQLGLADFIEEEDISRLRHSVSSIWWSGTHRIDEDKHVLLLEVAAQKTETLPISLETGAMMVPKRVMFPRPRVTWAAEDVTTCEDTTPLSAEELRARTSVADVPVYPIVANKARVAGYVLADITIDENGAVDRVEIVKPMPFGMKEAAEDSIRKWKFQPGKKACGRVRMNFEFAMP